MPSSSEICHQSHSHSFFFFFFKQWNIISKNLAWDVILLSKWKGFWLHQHLLIWTYLANQSVSPWAGSSWKWIFLNTHQELVASVRLPPCLHLIFPIHPHTPLVLALYICAFYPSSHVLPVSSNVYPLYMENLLKKYFLFPAVILSKEFSFILVSYWKVTLNSDGYRMVPGAGGVVLLSSRAWGQELLFGPNCWACDLSNVRLLQATSIRF